MESEPADKLPVTAASGSKLLQVIMAIALAIVSQLVLRDGHTLLAFAGFAAAVVLFVISVKESLTASSADQGESAAIREHFAGAQGTADKAAVDQAVAAILTAALAAESPELPRESAELEVQQAEEVVQADKAVESALKPSQSTAAPTIGQAEQAGLAAETAGINYETTSEAESPLAAAANAAQELKLADKLRYLRLHWRLLTLAEVLRGDIPPSREGLPEIIPAPAVEPKAVLPEAVEAPLNKPEPSASGTQPIGQKQATAAAPVAAAARPSESLPTSVKVTAWGDVLVLDTGRGQLQRFDEKGSLLATYSLSGLASVKVLDMDVTPDYKTLYVVDAASRLQVFTLTGDDASAL